MLPELHNISFEEVEENEETVIVINGKIVYWTRKQYELDLIENFIKSLKNEN